jgi:hypothetical protein
MVTHRFPLEDVDEGVQAAAAQEAVKVAVIPGWHRPLAESRSAHGVSGPGRVPSRGRRVKCQRTPTAVRTEWARLAIGDQTVD